MKPDASEDQGLIERIRDWRLPVRYRMPPRNDLIAFALMALAFGLMVGLAIAPGWGNAGSTGPVITLPAGEEAGTTGDTGTATVAAALEPPAGAESTTVSDQGSPGGSTSLAEGPGTDPVETTTAEAPVDPTDPPPEDTYVDPPPEPERPGEPDPGPSLIATVVGVDDGGYAVADGSGNLLYIHYRAEGAVPPKVGNQIGTGIDPLDNGTFVQFGGLENLGSKPTTKLTGAVSWVDRESGVITVSARGASVALDASEVIEGEVPALGQWVTATARFDAATDRAADDGMAAGQTEIPDPAEAEPEEPLTMPELTGRSLEASGDPLTQVDISGPVSWDPGLRTLTIGADGFGALNRVVQISVPAKLKLRGIVEGAPYAASADIGEDGSLTLAGLSANSSREAASDQSQAFGNHAR